MPPRSRPSRRLPPRTRQPTPPMRPPQRRGPARTSSARRSSKPSMGSESQKISSFAREISLSSGRCAPPGGAPPRP
eukprot:scaffold159598_cov30-Tisochrysis_lutea.AAC.4